MTTAIESAVLSEIFPGSPQAPKPMPSIPDWLNDYGLTAYEFRVYSYAVNRASLNGKCDDSVVEIADACRVARNVVLAALQNLSEVYHLLVRNKRPGLTDEYFIAPQSEWAEAIQIEDRVLSRQKISTSSTDSSFKRMGCDEVEPILYEDTNLVEAEELFEQSIEDQEECSDDVSDVTATAAVSSIWRRNADATRYCQIPPIHNQSVGVEIQRQIETEGLTAQAVVERAISFSKVPKLIFETLFTINQKLIAGHNWLTQAFQQRQNTGYQQNNCNFGCDLC